jgi:hypothetical protein
MAISSPAVSRGARGATPPPPRRHRPRIFAKCPGAPSAVSPDGRPRRRFPRVLGTRSQRECPLDRRFARSRHARRRPAGPRVARRFREARTREPPPRQSPVPRGGCQSRSVPQAEPTARHLRCRSHTVEPSAVGNEGAAPGAFRRPRQLRAKGKERAPTAVRLALAHSCCLGEWRASVARGKVLGPNRADVTHWACYPCTRSGGSLLSSSWRPRWRSS